MNLYNDASLIITPNGVKAGKLYALKGADLDVVRATSATRVNASGLIETVGANVPRLDYSNGSCPSILVEPQRTNNFTYSEQFDNAYWGKTDATVTANNTASPDGNNTADKVEFNSGFINGVDIVADNQTYTISFFAKKGTANLFQISEAFYVGTTVAFDLNSGTVTSGVGKIENYGNGWYRCSMQFTYGVGQVVSSWLLRNFQSGYIYLWGAQLEAGSYATSYIPTTSASVTRNADVISKTGISSLIGQTEGTLFADIYYQSTTNGVNYVVNSLNNGDYGNAIFIDLFNNSLSINIFKAYNLEAKITKTSLTTGRHKIAAAYKLNDIVFYVDGVQIGIDTTAAIPTLGDLNLGYLGSTISTEQSFINSTQIYKTRLTNTELAQLTTL